MVRTEQNKQALTGASRNAQKAIDAVSAPEFANTPAKEKTAWAMAAMIHCDVCRLVIAYDECEREGIARLLWMADIISKLHEAKNWYSKTGGQLLQDIAKTKKFGVDSVRKNIKDINAKHSIANINSYSDYRNKLGYHYDKDALDYLEKFGKEDADKFFKLLSTFVQFSGEWATLTKLVIQDNLA